MEDFMRRYVFCWLLFIVSILVLSPIAWIIVGILVDKLYLFGLFELLFEPVLIYTWYLTVDFVKDEW